MKSGSPGPLRPAARLPQLGSCSVAWPLRTLPSALPTALRIPLLSVTRRHVARRRLPSATGVSSSLPAAGVLCQTPLWLLAKELELDPRKCWEKMLNNELSVFLSLICLLPGCLRGSGRKPLEVYKFTPKWPGLPSPASAVCLRRLQGGWVRDAEHIVDPRGSSEDPVLPQDPTNPPWQLLRVSEGGRRPGYG